MFSAVGCFCLQGLHSLPGTGRVPAIACKSRKPFLGAAVGRMDGRVCKGGVRAWFSPGIQKPAVLYPWQPVKWARRVWGAAAQCVSVLLEAWF